MPEERLDLVQKDSINKQRRKITWCDPPFNINATASVAKVFLSLIDKHFPKSNELHKIINQNTNQVSYPFLPNLRQAISNHQTPPPKTSYSKTTGKTNPQNVKNYATAEKVKTVL